MKKSIKEDWPVIPFMVFFLAGVVVSVLDFIFLQKLVFQVLGVVGLVLLALGVYIRNKARLILIKKAGFGSLVSTARLQTVKGQRLVIDGLYRYIRHPVYLGQILAGFGFVLIFSSLYGMLLVAVATIFLLFRIEIEEKMLIEAFDEEYKEYQRNTKKMIPYIY